MSELIFDVSNGRQHSVYSDKFLTLATLLTSGELVASVLSACLTLSSFALRRLTMCNLRLPKWRDESCVHTPQVIPREWALSWFFRSLIHITAFLSTTARKARTMLNCAEQDSFLSFYLSQKQLLFQIQFRRDGANLCDARPVRGTSIVFLLKPRVVHEVKLTREMHWRISSALDFYVAMVIDVISAYFSKWTFYGSVLSMW